ncbi:MAG TPA: methionyl-tRNA formyltransferase [Clostridiales bacterium]|nr:methionyl-tRNA formyltransferase [Clostridiales bacterium]
MKVIYMGSPDFSVYGLKALMESGHDLVAAVSRGDKSQGRKKQLRPTALKSKALELGISVYTPENVNDPAFYETLRGLEADVIVVSAFGGILKKELLELCPYGVINIHGSLLPLYRGASPMNAVLRDGQKETGITIMYMNEGMDAGDILMMEALPIGVNENFTSLKQRMGVLGGELIVKSLDLLKKGEAPRIAQDHERATYCQLLTREDERIHWQNEGLSIHNQIRSLSLTPGAFTYWDRQPFKILTTVFETADSRETAGTIVAFDKKKGVACAVAGGYLWLLSVKPQGKKEMSAIDWYRGLHLHEKPRFTTEP